MKNAQFLHLKKSTATKVSAIGASEATTIADILRYRLPDDPSASSLLNRTSAAGMIATAVRSAASEKISGRFSIFPAATSRQ